MNEDIKREYERLRRSDWPAEMALRCARTRVRFEELEAQSLVKLKTIPEYDYYDDSWIETHGLRQCNVDRLRKEINQRIDREGCWILISYYRLSEDESWIDIDSVGGFIGDDYDDSGYDTDLMQAAIDALDKAWQVEADEMARRATYAAGMSP